MDTQLSPVSRNGNCELSLQISGLYGMFGTAAAVVALGVVCVIVIKFVVA